jgi:hypothetical protein
VLAIDAFDLLFSIFINEKALPLGQRFIIAIKLAKLRLCIAMG